MEGDTIPGADPEGGEMGRKHRDAGHEEDTWRVGWVRVWVRELGLES